MLPDFPYIKRKCRIIIEKIRQDYINQDPILSEIKICRDFEGNKMSTSDVNGNIELSNYTEYYSEKSISDEDIINRGLEVFYEKTLEMADEVRRKLKHNMFQKLEEITKKAGTSINAKGKPFSADLLLEMFDKIQLDFDEEGNPKFPTIVISPEMFESIKDKLPSHGEEPEFDKRFEELILKKRRECYDRESDRKLVD